MICKICSDILMKQCHLNHQNQFLRCLHQNHYDVLKVKRTCTPQEIKDAFIKLSKEHHPDVNKSKHANERFQKINEAYKVLGKRESRASYDLGLANPESFRESYNYYSSHRYNHTYHDPTYKNPYSDPSFWMNRNRTRDRFYRDHPYYGIEGIPRLPNTFIFIMCVFFSFIGMGMQFIMISKSTTFKREMMQQRSEEMQRHLNEVEGVATKNGNETQLEILKTKLMVDEE